MTQDTQHTRNMCVYDKRVLYYWNHVIVFYVRTITSCYYFIKQTYKIYSAFLFRFGFFISNNNRRSKRKQRQNGQLENICVKIFSYLLLSLLKILCAHSTVPDPRIKLIFIILCLDPKAIEWIGNLHNFVQRSP